MKAGITGQSGFIGSHLYNFLSLQKNIEMIDFEDGFFNNREDLDNFTAKCDVIIHLAAMNRHNNPEKLYNTNIELTKKLISSLERTGSKAHVLVSSSTQENRDNLYGKSKKESRKLLLEWSKKNNSKFTGFIIPNVFGPFGNPYYNSFIATFSYRIVNNEEPEIQSDSEIDLIYVYDLAQIIYKHAAEGIATDKFVVPHIASRKVSDVLETLYKFKNEYVDNGIFPNLESYFDLCLFNTFRSYLPKDFFPKKLALHKDNRGSFVETVKSLSQGQFSFSTTKPGITRGNHFHIRKVERFAVIKGKAEIKLRRIGTDESRSYILDGNEPGFVDMPVWFTHNIKNIGDEDLITLFWINEFFDLEDPDTYYEEV